MKTPSKIWWLLTVTATPQLMLNRKWYQASKPEMEFNKRHCPRRYKQKRRHFHAQTTVHWWSPHGAGHILFCGSFCCCCPHTCSWFKWAEAYWLTFVGLVFLKSHIRLSWGCVDGFDWFIDQSISKHLKLFTTSFQKLLTGMRYLVKYNIFTGYFLTQDLYTIWDFVFSRDKLFSACLVSSLLTPRKQNTTTKFHHYEEQSKLIHEQNTPIK